MESPGSGQNRKRKERPKERRKVWGKGLNGYITLHCLGGARTGLAGEMCGKWARVRFLQTEAYFIKMLMSGNGYD